MAVLPAVAVECAGRLRSRSPSRRPDRHSSRRTAEALPAGHPRPPSPRPGRSGRRSARRAPSPTPSPRRPGSVAAKPLRLPRPQRATAAPEMVRTHTTGSLLRPGRSRALTDGGDQAYSDGSPQRERVPSVPTALDRSRPRGRRFALLGLGSAARADTYPAIYVTFQQNHTFAITLADGTPVGTTTGAPTVIPGGTYQLFLNDTSGAIMQLDLSGPGVSLNTNMTNGEDLAAAYVETFQTNSTYTYRDDYQQNSPVLDVRHLERDRRERRRAATRARARLRVRRRRRAAAEPRPRARLIGSATKTVPFRGTLLGAVTPAGGLALDQGGKSVGILKAGKYKVKVTDRSKKSGFNLQEIRKSGTTVTGTTFVGTRSVTIDFKAGQWFFYPTFSARRRISSSRPKFVALTSTPDYCGSAALRVISTRPRGRLIVCPPRGWAQLECHRKRREEWRIA